MGVKIVVSGLGANLWSIQFPELLRENPTQRKALLVAQNLFINIFPAYQFVFSCCLAALGAQEAKTTEDLHSRDRPPLDMLEAPQEETQHVEA